jgi:hypothetical protein
LVEIVNELGWQEEATARVMGFLTAAGMNQTTINSNGDWGTDSGHRT